jgi:hypothetical protein
MRFSTLGLLHQSTPSRALIHGLKPFCIWPNIHWKNRQYSNFSGVNDPAATGLPGSLTPLKTISVGSLTPLKLPEFFFKNFSYKVTKLWNNSKISCVISVESLTPPKRVQRCHWPHWNNFREVIDHAEIILAGSLTPLKFIWPLKYFISLRWKYIKKPVFRFTWFCSLCMRFSTLGFFHQSTPPRALIHGLKPFRIWPNIRRKNRQYSNFSGVNDPAATGLPGSLTPLKRFQWVHWPLRNNFSGVIDPAKMFSAGSLTPLKQFQRGHWPRWNDFIRVIDPT